MMDLEKCHNEHAIRRRQSRIFGLLGGLVLLVAIFYVITLIRL